MATASYNNGDLFDLNNSNLFSLSGDSNSFSLSSDGSSFDLFGNDSLFSPPSNNNSFDIFISFNDNRIIDNKVIDKSNISIDLEFFNKEEWDEKE